MNSIEQDEAIRDLRVKFINLSCLVNRLEKEVEALNKHRIVVRDGVAYFADGTGRITEHIVA